MWSSSPSRTVTGEPLVDLVRSRGQAVLNRRLHLPRPNSADPRQPAQLLLVGSRAILHYTRRFCRGQVLAHRRPRQPDPFRYPTLTASRQPAAYRFLYFHSDHLLVRHRCTSTSKCTNGRRCGSQSGLMALKIWPAYSP